MARQMALGLLLAGCLADLGHATGVRGATVEASGQHDKVESLMIALGILTFCIMFVFACIYKAQVVDGLPQMDANLDQRVVTVNKFGIWKTVEKDYELRAVVRRLSAELPTQLQAVLDNVDKLRQDLPVDLRRVLDNLDLEPDELRDRLREVLDTAVIRAQDVPGRLRAVLDKVEVLPDPDVDLLADLREVLDDVDKHSDIQPAVILDRLKTVLDKLKSLNEVVNKLPGDVPVELAAAPRKKPWNVCFYHRDTCLHTTFCFDAVVAKNCASTGICPFWLAYLCMSAFHLSLLAGLPGVLLAFLAKGTVRMVASALIRDRLGYKPDLFRDVLCNCFCTYCEVGRESLQVDEELGVEIKCCCQVTKTRSRVLPQSVSLPQVGGDAAPEEQEEEQAPGQQQLQQANGHQTGGEGESEAPYQRLQDDAAPHANGQELGGGAAREAPLPSFYHSFGAEGPPNFGVALLRADSLQLGADAVQGQAQASRSDSSEQYGSFAAEGTRDLQVGLLRGTDGPHVGAEAAAQEVQGQAEVLEPEVD